MNRRARHRGLASNIPILRPVKSWTPCGMTFSGRSWAAAIDMLENAINVCPDELWSDPSEKPAWSSRGVVGFWHVAYHALFFLDLQLSGSLEGFSPPAPFNLSELDPDGRLPERPYAKAEVQSYLRHCREKCRSTLASLTEEQARRVCFSGSPYEMPFAELLLYTLRHVQHHVAQLNLLLRQNVGAAPTWVKRGTAARI